QPNNRPANDDGCPFDRAHHPWATASGQIGCRRLVQNEGRVTMLLEKAGRDGISDVGLHSPSDDGGLVFTKRHDDDLASFQDSADAHRQRLVRNILFAKKTAGGVPTRYGIEGCQSRAALADRTGFVETDMSCSADTQQLEINAAR